MPTASLNTLVRLLLYFTFLAPGLPLSVPPLPPRPPPSPPGPPRSPPAARQVELSNVFIRNATELVTSVEEAALYAAEIQVVYAEEDQETLNFLWKEYLNVFHVNVVNKRNEPSTRHLTEIQVNSSQDNFEVNLKFVADFNLEASATDWKKINEYGGLSNYEFEGNFTAPYFLAPPPSPLPPSKKGPKRLIRSLRVLESLQAAQRQKLRSFGKHAVTGVEIQQKLIPRSLYYYDTPEWHPAPFPSLDWRMYGIVPRVKFDGHCGASWASAYLSAIEAAVLLQYPDVDPSAVNYSLEQVLACASSSNEKGKKKEGHFESMGCNGGFPHEVGLLAFESGLVQALEFPYNEGTEACPQNGFPGAEKLIAAERGTTVAYEGRSALSLMEALVEGPIVVLLDACGIGYQLYGGGIYNPTDCSSLIYNHALLLIGFKFTGTLQDPSGYWIARNSWGSTWGVYGDIQIAMTPEGTPGMCGMYRFAYAPPRNFEFVPGVGCRADLQESIRQTGRKAGKKAGTKAGTKAKK